MCGNKFQIEGARLVSDNFMLCIVKFEDERKGCDQIRYVTIVPIINIMKTHSKNLI